MNTAKSVKADRDRGFFYIPPRKRRGLCLFLASVPFLVFFFMFSYVPLFGWIYTVYDYRLGLPFLDLTQARFVGLGNFQKIIAESNEVLRVLRNTLIMSFLNLLFSPLPIIFAILLNEVRRSKLRRIIQTISTFPHFISWIIVFSLAHAMFSPSGLVTELLLPFGIGSQMGLIGDINSVWPFQLALNIWKTLGWSAIIYIATISGIDSELYDAAMVDGANRFQSTIYVTIPGIIPTYLVLLLLAISNILTNGFEQYFMFYNSLVAERIEVLDYYVYRMGIIVGDFSFSITIGMLRSVISIFLLFFVNYLSKRLRGQSLI